MSDPAAHPSGAAANFRVVRALGKRSQPTQAALREPHELVVLNVFGEGTDAETRALLLRDARCLEKNWHPNIARIRHVALEGSCLSVASELIDGVTLDTIMLAATRRTATSGEPPLPFPIVARILVDVLAGLHGLHGLRDGMNASLNAFHGELCPANIVLGKDGVARIVNVLRPRPIRIAKTSEALGYASPETIAGETTQDSRADIYALGVILWEAIAGKRLFPEPDPARTAQRQREEDLESPAIAPDSPFVGLADVALRAIEFDPTNRFRTALEMAAEIRRIASNNLATGATVAQKVAELAGDDIRARRAKLDTSPSGARRTSSANSLPAQRPPAAGLSRVPPAQRALKTGSAKTTTADGESGEDRSTRVPSELPPPTTRRDGSPAPSDARPSHAPPIPIVAPRPAASIEPAPADATTPDGMRVFDADGVVSLESDALIAVAAPVLASTPPPLPPRASLAFAPSFPPPTPSAPATVPSLPPVAPTSSSPMTSPPTSSPVAAPSAPASSPVVAPTAAPSVPSVPRVAPPPALSSAPIPDAAESIPIPIPPPSFPSPSAFPVAPPSLPNASAEGPSPSSDDDHDEAPIPADAVPDPAFVVDAGAHRPSAALGIASDRRKRLTLIVASAVGAAAVLSVGALLASRGSSDDPAKSANANAGTNPTISSAASATPSAAPVEKAIAAPEPTPTPTPPTPATAAPEPPPPPDPEPAPPPVAKAPAPVRTASPTRPTVATTPRTNPTPATPKPRPKKKSFDPSGI